MKVYQAKEIIRNISKTLKEFEDFEHNKYPHLFDDSTLYLDIVSHLCSYRRFLERCIENTNIEILAEMKREDL